MFKVCRIVTTKSGALAVNFIFKKEFITVDFSNVDAVKGGCRGRKEE